MSQGRGDNDARRRITYSVGIQNLAMEPGVEPFVGDSGVWRGRSRRIHRPWDPGAGPPESPSIRARAGAAGTGRAVQVDLAQGLRRRGGLPRPGRAPLAAALRVPRADPRRGPSPRRGPRHEAHVSIRVLGIDPGASGCHGAGPGSSPQVQSKKLPRTMMPAWFASHLSGPTARVHSLAPGRAPMPGARRDVAALRSVAGERPRCRRMATLGRDPLHRRSTGRAVGTADVSPVRTPGPHRASAGQGSRACRCP